MKSFSLLTVLLTGALALIAAPNAAQADESRTATYGASKSKTVTATVPVRSSISTPPSQPYSGRISADTGNSGIAVTNAPENVERTAPTKFGETVRSNTGFTSSKEIDEASRASVLNGKRLDAPIRERNLDPVPRIQELGF